MEDTDAQYKRRMEMTRCNALLFYVFGLMMYVGTGLFLSLSLIFLSTMIFLILAFVIKIFVTIELQRINNDYIQQKIRDSIQTPYIIYGNSKPKPKKRRR